MKQQQKQQHHHHHHQPPYHSRNQYDIENRFKPSNPSRRQIKYNNQCSAFPSAFCQYNGKERDSFYFLPNLNSPCKLINNDFVEIHFLSFQKPSVPDYLVPPILFTVVTEEQRSRKVSGIWFTAVTVEERDRKVSGVSCSLQ